MAKQKDLYRTALNPLLICPGRGLPSEMAVVGAGTIGPDIGYYLKSALPGSRLFLVDVVEAPLKRAEQRLADYAAKAVDKKKMKPNSPRRCWRTSSTRPTTAGQKLRTGHQGRYRKHSSETEDFRFPGGNRRGGCHHHFQHQLHPGGPALQPHGAPAAGHRYPFLRPGLAQPAG